MVLSSGFKKKNRKTAPKSGSGDPVAEFSKKVEGACGPCAYLSSINYCMACHAHRQKLWVYPAQHISS